MTWVDTHCHLQLDGRDPADLLKRAPDVDWLVAPGIDARSSMASAELAGRHGDRVLATSGLHPHEATEWAGQRDAIIDLAPRVSAIGETGLDFYRDLSPRSAQIQAFTSQIQLAADVDKPLIVHCRDAFKEVYSALETSGAGPRAVLHSWTGGTRWTKRFLDLGVMISYSGVLAFDTAETIRLGAELVPPERALTETDTPYLAPPPHRGERNEPAWVALVGEALARVWGAPVDEVARVTSENAGRVFR